MVRAALLLLLLLQAPAAAQSGKPSSSSTGVATLVARARAARYQQDSLLASYETVVRQRMSAGIGLARGLGTLPVGRPRLAARFESVARVGWHHELGAWGEVLGVRGVAPIVGEVVPSSGGDEPGALVLPYYPGRDRLWPVTEIRDGLPIVGNWIVHPLDPGADSLYAFSLGDSITFHLPNGSVIALRELRLRPRRPASQLVVGSLWLDVASGALVRAAYRPSVPVDLWPFFQKELDDEDAEKVLRKLGPFTGSVREIIVEHGLYAGRFWLPRTRILSGEATAKGGRVTVDITQTFTYASVTALASTSEYRAQQAATPDIDPRDGRVRRGRWTGRDEDESCRPLSDTRSRSADSLLRDPSLSVMWGESVRFRVLVPCDKRSLGASPELPKSIYSDDEQLFTDTDLGALRKEVEGALSISRQAKWNPQPPAVYYGIDRGMLRYNRVEGLSAGVAADRLLGNGYTAGGQARMGSADLQPNGEAFLERSNIGTAIRVAGYRRLVAANDWGAPLSLGASLGALVFGRDDGFYYRSAGAELGGTMRGSTDGWAVGWRMFAERQDSAQVETGESIGRLFSHRGFRPNIQALAGNYFGGSAVASYAWGSDPTGTRVAGAVRAEGAGGEARFGRFMAEQSLMQGFGQRVQATLSAGAGISVGDLPPQRLWYLGGGQTLRGYRAGELAGNAFWLGRVELARGSSLFRPAVFFDIAWAGDRDTWAHSFGTRRGVGTGITTLDGVARLDVARGLDGGGRWRLDLYFDLK